MAKDCLYNQFKGRVSDNSLPIFGVLEFFVKSGKVATFSLGSYPLALTIMVEGDGVLQNNGGTSYGKSYTHLGGTWSGPTKVVATGDCRVSISDFKYTFDYLSLDKIEIDPNMVLYNTPQGTRTFVGLFLTNCKLLSDLDVSSIQNLGETGNVSLINCSGGNIYGKFTNITGRYYNCNRAFEPLMNASVLQGKSNVSRVSLPIEGDIKYLGYTSVGGNNTSSISGKNLYLHGVKGHENNNTWTTGSIEELVTTLISNGRNSGVIQIESPKNFRNVTFEGVSLYQWFLDNPQKTSNHKSILVWDSSQPNNGIDWSNLS